MDVKTEDACALELDLRSALQSALVQEALFACGWERWARGASRASRVLLLARERARRPLRAVAAGVIPLSLETFLKASFRPFPFSV